MYLVDRRVGVLPLRWSALGSGHVKGSSQLFVGVVNNAEARLSAQSDPWRCDLD